MTRKRNGRLHRLLRRGLNRLQNINEVKNIRIYIHRKTRTPESSVSIFLMLAATLYKKGRLQTRPTALY